MIVQIYGLTAPDDMRAIADLGIDHVGVVLEEGHGTWDAVNDDTARAIIREVPSATKVVALSLHTEPEAILATAAVLAPAVVHLARAESIDSAVLAELRRCLAPVELMTTVPVRDATAMAEARRLAAVSDFLLLDTAHPATGVVGATGHVHDWALSRSVVEAVDVPVVLAGGLGPENVREAIGTVRPWGVDSETRTSRDDDRRRKDVEKVHRFVAAARDATPTIR